MMKKKTNHQRGIWAEKISIIYLWLKGYSLIATRFGAGQKGGGKGEIDLIMRKGKTIVFIEVKYRQSEEDALFAISSMQKNRIRRNAELFLKRFPRYQCIDCRFDAMLLSKGKLLPTHIKNAF